MTQVGIRELKAHLSRYIAQVRRGRCVTVTDRRRAVAVLSPAVGASPGGQALEDMRRRGIVVGEGRKPVGLKKRVRLKGGALVSDVLLEERGDPLP